MADLHKAILSIHNNAISVSGDTQETIIAKDKDEMKLVLIDTS